MIKTSIESSEIQWGPTIRSFDVNGRVFFWEGRVFRAIYSPRVGFVRKLFDSGIVDELVSQNLLVPTQITDLDTPGFGLVLEHEMQDVQSLAREWSYVTLKDAATVYLELLRRLTSRGLTLQDGHSGNFSLSRGGRVRWHDFGSIVEMREGRFAGLNEFARSLLLPLELAQTTGALSLVRRLDFQVTPEEFLRIRGFGIDRLLLQSSSNKTMQQLQKARIRFGQPDVRGHGRLRFGARFLTAKISGRAWSPQLGVEGLDKIQRRVDRLQFRQPPTMWSHYHSPIDEATVASPRDTEIERLLSVHRPQRVLDIGANAGRFSRAAARSAEVVIATDTDEQATSQHVLDLRTLGNKARIYPLIHDIIRLTDSEASRLSADLVLALALTHHLRLGQGYPFTFIAKTLSRVTKKVLITEFMPNGLGGNRGPSPDPLPADYKLETFMRELGRVFEHVDQVDTAQLPGASPRVLITAERR